MVPEDLALCTVFDSLELGPCPLDAKELGLCDLADCMVVDDLSTHARGPSPDRNDGEF